MPQVRTPSEHAGPGAATGTGATSATPSGLREIFADLISYVLLFQASCAERPPAANELREKIDALIGEQERRVKTGAVSWDAYREALFAVLAWLDEAILNSSWPHRSQWRHLMLTTFRTLNAGNEFFQRLEALPAAARDVKEIYFYCLSLGFEGKYALGGDTAQLQEYRRRLYRDIAGAGDVRRDRLFPEAYGRPRGAAPSKRRRWGIAWFALALLGPALLFGIYWYLLHRQTADLLARIAAPIEVVQPPKPPERARTLVEELRARGIQAEQAARGVVITLPSLLFHVNSAELSEQGKRRIAEVADALRRHAAGLPVLVEGHASREQATPEERNQRLSEDRATNVVALLKESGLRNERVTGKGFGSRSPVASNDTDEGRRQNRRVEIVVENIR